MSDNNNKRYEIIYRPKTFSDVLGQDRIVEELSALIRRGKVGRNLLFAGDRGSGKTSLVRLYAQALNCENNDLKGNPCLNCRMCRAEREDRGMFKYDGRGLFEYDTAAKGGDKETIARVMDAVRRTDIAGTKRITFFDEAHALERPAVDALLKDIEEGGDDLIYCFATTAPRALGAPLLSRLWTYTVRALPEELAIGLLRRVAEAQKMSVDIEALKLLAAVKRNYPRDLLIGLGQMDSTGEHITTDTVKNAFGIDQVDILVDYFSALARGGKEHQAQIFADWNEATLIKAEWISAFLVSLYYNHVLGQKRVIDPLIHASIGSHAGIVESWQKRLGINDERRLRKYYEWLLGFWAAHRPRDESSAALVIALFEGMADRAEPASLIPEPGAEARNLTQEPNSELAPAPDAAVMVTDEGNVASVALNEFVTPEDVQKIVNRASYFAQHYGDYLNTSLEIYPRSHEEDDAVAEINVFCADLAQHFGARRWEGGAPFAGIALIDRSKEQGIFGLMMAYVGIDDYKIADAELNAYIENYEKRLTGRTAADFHLRPNKSKSVAFHWDGVLNLCASLDEPKQRGGRLSKPRLLDLLGVRQKRRRPARRIRGTRLSFFGAVNDGAIEQAQDCKMGLLSAFDDRAFEWIGKGWEKGEALARQKQLQERKRQIAIAEDLYASNPGVLKRQIDDLEAGWSVDAKRRHREWTGWWK